MTLAASFYQSAPGREPVREWLKTDLLPEDRRAIGADIKTVQEGWPLGMPLVRKMDPGLWEIRSRITDGVARILFTVVGAEMVLLHGFVKKTDKTPKADLELARKRRNEVRE